MLNPLDFFRNNHNCAQSVLLAFTDELEMDPDIMRLLAAGLGGGMGRCQLTCGAITGGVMALGAILAVNSHTMADPVQRKKFINTHVADFVTRFAQANGATDCLGLMQCDLRTEEGRENFIKRQQEEKICEGFVSTAAALVEDIRQGVINQREL